MSSETDTVVKTTAATIRYLAGWFDTEKERAHLLEIALEVEATEGHEACCPVCQEVTCDRGCPLEPFRDRCQSEALADYRKQHGKREQ